MSINRNLANFATSITSDGKAYITITVTVASVGGSNKYHIDGTAQQNVSLSKGITYRFDVSDSSVSGHPFVFSTGSNGAGSSFTTGISTVGSAGSAGAYVQVTLEQDAPDHLGYYCSNHSGMGGLVKTAPIGDANFASFAGAFTFPTSDGSANQVLKTDGSGTLGFATVAASYGNSDVDSHLNQSNPTSGYVLSWNGSDYAWVDNAGYTDANVNTHLNVSGASSGQILGWNGSDYAWVDDQSGSGGIASVLADTTPQLGGSLDVNGQAIVSVSDGNIAITPNGSGKVILDGLSYPQADGNANEVLKTDGSGNLSFVAQSTGGGGGSVTATASGALTNGQLIVVNSDGTVSAVSATQSNAIGSTVKYHSNRTVLQMDAVFDSASNRVVVAYRDGSNSNYGTAVIGTVSGTSISWGTPVVFESANTSDLSVCFDSNNNKIVIAYSDNGNSSYGTAIVGTVSNTTISFGSAAVFESASTNYIAAVFDSTNNKVVIGYNDNANSSYGTAIVGTISGTSISFGSASVFASHSITYTRASFNSNAGKTVFAWANSSSSNALTTIVATVSGTSLSYGAAVVVDDGSISFDVEFDSSNNKTVVFYGDSGDNGYGKARVGTISGTAISYGSAVTFNSANTNNVAAIFDATANKFIVAYKDFGNNSGHGTLIRGTVSGTSISFADEATFNAAATESIFGTYGSDSVILAFRDDDSSGDDATSVVVTNAATIQKLTAENFIGIADAAYSSGATATIQTAGSTDDAQSGLTAGQSYYVQADGTLGLSPDTISVLAGTAVSATKILINPDTNPAIFGNTQVDAHLNVSGASSGQILSWNGSDYAWTADGGGLNIVSSHSQTLSSNTTVAATDNAMSVGPVSIASGVTLTISSGARYAVI